MKRNSTFKLVLLVVFALALVANNAQAQQQSPPPVNAWVIGADFAPASMVHATGLLPPLDTTVDQKKDPWATVFVGYKPLGGLGVEARFTMFGGTAAGAGSIAQTDGTLLTWGVDATPKFSSSAPVLNGPAVYSIKSSAKISRIDFLGNYSWALPGGWFSVNVGMAGLRAKISEEVARDQGFLFYTKLPNGQLDTIGDREDYAFSSTASTSATMFGVTGGADGAVCLISNLVLEGRASVATFPLGSAKNEGQFSATKDIYLVNVAGGINATPISTLAHLNWAPNALPYAESVKQTVTAVDVKVGLKWKVRVGERATLNLGLGISRSSLSNLPTTASYVISDPYAVGNGKFGARTTNASVWASVVTVGVWF